MHAERIATQHEPDFRRAVQRALALVTGRHASLEALIAAWGRSHDVVHAIPWHLFETELSDRLYPKILDVLQSSIAAHGKDLLAHKIEGPGMFQLDNPEAVAWARRHAGELVQGISERSKEAIREIVSRLMAGDISAADAAERIRSVIGLAPRDAVALDNFRQGLLQRVAQNTMALDYAMLQVDQYRRRLLADRATLIARTETITAANQGQQQLWRQAVDRGFLDPARVKRRWIVTPDERLCYICAGIPDNGPVGLHDPFQGGDGNLYDVPPAHPACRCTMALVQELSPLAQQMVGRL